MTLQPSREIPVRMVDGSLRLTARCCAWYDSLDTAVALAGDLSMGLQKRSSEYFTRSETIQAIYHGYNKAVRL